MIIEKSGYYKLNSRDPEWLEKGHVIDYCCAVEQLPMTLDDFERSLSSDDIFAKKLIRLARAVKNEFHYDGFYEDESIEALEEVFGEDPK